MQADIDFDIIAHLGYFRNVAMSLRGYVQIKWLQQCYHMLLFCVFLFYCYRVYFIQVSLYYGDVKISPVGMFSAPSALDSNVGKLKVICSVLYNKIYIYRLEMQSTYLVLITFTEHETIWIFDGK